MACLPMGINRNDAFVLGKVVFHFIGTGVEVFSLVARMSARVLVSHACNFFLVLFVVLPIFFLFWVFELLCGCILCYFSFVQFFRMLSASVIVIRLLAARCRIALVLFSGWLFFSNLIAMFVVIR
jgi:hypothetical protein